MIAVRRLLVPGLCSLTAAALLAGAGACLPAAAGADATAAPPPTYSSASGLPDGRVYEQVSPVQKNGNEAGAGSNPYLYGGGTHYSVASPEGNSIFFWGSGPMGLSTAGYDLYFVAHHTVGGWSTASAIPRWPKPAPGGTLETHSPVLDPSADLSHIVFYGPTQSQSECASDKDLAIAGTEPQTAAVALANPQIPVPDDESRWCGQAIPAGGTADFSTLYFTDSAVLLPEDSVRAPHVGEESSTSPWGFYENTEGSIKEAGVLPNGSLDPFGAVPAGSLHQRRVDTNQVSTNGKRAFFVSPDPDSCANGNDCATDPPELYVHEQGEERAVLVSQDQLLPQANGLPADAPDGVTGFASPEPLVNSQFIEKYESGESLAYASPDGSNVFFQSDNCLTKAALVNEVCVGGVKTYDFGVDTGSLTYLPGISGHFVASSTDGSAVAFVSSSSPAEIERWEDTGPEGGTVNPIAPLETVATPGESGGVSGVSVARMSNEGSVVVFQTNAPIAGFNDGGTHLGRYGEILPGTEQIYRYEDSTNELSCVSCPPPGIIPTGDARMSAMQGSEIGSNRIVGEESEFVDERGISADGSRVFFDTPDPLVPQDTDARAPTIELAETKEIEEHGRDVYEWEDGTDYLISAGSGLENSFVLDNSESGDDVFFATANGLVAGDTDGAYDVYDARIPHEGDNPPPAAVPCAGSVCQGPPHVPSPLGAPASATFSGLGNPSPVPTSTPATPKKTTTKTVKCKKGFVEKKDKCIRSKPKKKTKHAEKAGHNGRTKS